MRYLPCCAGETIDRVLPGTICPSIFLLFVKSGCDRPYGNGAPDRRGQAAWAGCGRLQCHAQTLVEREVSLPVWRGIGYSSATHLSGEMQNGKYLLPPPRSLISLNISIPSFLAQRQLSLPHPLHGGTRVVLRNFKLYVARGLARVGLSRWMRKTRYRLLCNTYVTAPGGKLEIL